MYIGVVLIGRINVANIAPELGPMQRISGFLRMYSPFTLTFTTPMSKDETPLTIIVECRILSKLNGYVEFPDHSMLDSSEGYCRWRRILDDALFLLSCLQSHRMLRRMIYRSREDPSTSDYLCSSTRSRWNGSVIWSAVVRGLIRHKSDIDQGSTGEATFTQASL